MSKKISQMPQKGTDMVLADEFTILDSADADPTTKNKRIGRDLALSSRQLTVPGDGTTKYLGDGGEASKWSAAGSAAQADVGAGASEVPTNTTVDSKDTAAIAGHNADAGAHNGNLPTSDQKAALAGEGTNPPNGLNPYATINDLPAGGGSVSVEDDGSEIVADASVLNFTGAGVTVTDGGAGQANIAIPGVGGAWDGDITDIDLVGGTDIGAALSDEDLILVDDGASGTNRKAAMSRVRMFTHLAHVVGADADTSMAINSLYVVDMSGWATADRTYTLPATCAVGDRIGIAVMIGNASHELIIKPAAGDTINGGSAGEEWSRLFITGELVIMRCVVANSAWLVDSDLRIPSKASVILSASTTDTPLLPNTWVEAQFDTEKYDVGNILETSGKIKRIRVRRKGVYLCSHRAGIANIANVLGMTTRFELDDGVTPERFTTGDFPKNYSGAAAYVRSVAIGMTGADPGDAIRAYIYQSSSVTSYDIYVGSGGITFMWCVEQL